MSVGKLKIEWTKAGRARSRLECDFLEIQVDGLAMGTPLSLRLANGMQLSPCVGDYLVRIDVDVDTYGRDEFLAQWEAAAPGTPEAPPVVDLEVEEAPQ